MVDARRQAARFARKGPLRWAVFALAAAGCYQPNVADGTYLCPDQVCPQGMACSQCGRCIRAGEPLAMGCTDCADVIACVEAASCPLMSGTSCVAQCEASATQAAQTDAEAVMACMRQSCNARCSTGIDADCRSCRAATLRGEGSPLGPCKQALDPACGKCLTPYQTCAAAR